VLLIRNMRSGPSGERLSSQVKLGMGNGGVKRQDVPDKKTRRSSDQVAVILKNHTQDNLLSIREEILPGD
jgi:hypothetical protein